MRRRTRPTKMRRAGIGLPMRSWVSTQLSRVHEDRKWSVCRLVVMLLLRLLLHGRIVWLCWTVMENRGPRVMDRGPVMLRAVAMRRLALVARMRVLW